MRILKYRSFWQWAKAEGLDDKTLKQATKEIEQGLFEAILGSGLYKKRIARIGQGKRSSYRTLIALKLNDRAIFMYGFAKNERVNISSKEKDVYRRLAKYYLGITDMQLNILIEKGELIEVI